MTLSSRALDDTAFERLCEHVAVATVHCSDQQVLDLADSLHAALRRRRARHPLRWSEPWPASNDSHGGFASHG